jgi:hypothetical protein
LIQIFTFVTDHDGYSQMRRTFEQAGFTRERAAFVDLHSAGGPGEPDPYRKITELVADLTEPFFILCHQDLRLDRGHGIDELLSAIAELDERDDRWAVAGNAGGSRSLRVIRSVTDPHGGGSGDSLPARVHSLDENFLVIRTGTGVGCSRELSGFHMYGTDLCLNALEQGRHAYVIDFSVRHLSSGTKDAAYASARDALVARWSPRFLARYVRTTVDVLFLSRSRLLMRVLGSARALRTVKNSALLRRVAGGLLARGS